ncbi:MAG TPA: PAS domain-containing protein [Steroidobacteraceae bacterium]|nr:PAS domain-containing protein [Steroidobacteraceae bacterium]
MEAQTDADNGGIPRPTLSLIQEGIETALNLVDVGVWQHFFPEDNVVCSDGFYRMLGVDCVEGRAMQDFWRSRLHPEDATRQDLAYGDFVQGIAPVYEETYRLRHEQGRWICVLARARWITRSDGKPGRLALGYVIDVTARTADFDRLRAREERFRMSLSALHGVVYDLDLRTNKTERHGLKRVFGYDQVDEAGDEFGGWLRLIHPDDLARFTSTIEAQRLLGTNYEMNYRVRHRDGSWRHVRQSATYTLGHDGKPIRAYGVIEDITEEQEQREQLQLQAAIIERMSEGVMLVAEDATILFANPALEKMFGYQCGELTGRNAQTLSFRSDANFAGLLRTVFEGTENNRTSIIDLEGRHSNGEICPVQGYFSSLMLGSRRCVVAVLADIAERKQLERELMQVATSVQQRIGGDLHDDLGQQLAGIAMMLQSLGQRAAHAGSPPLSAAVDQIVQLVNSAIRSTRSLARGLSPVRPSPDGLMEGLEELVNQVFERYGIRVRMELSLPPSATLDENTATNLYRIAQEGVLNAARHADATQIHLRLRVAGADVELLVIDDGKGFDPLQHARGGMGLRIMRYRAQLIGGYLSVESRPGAGTTLRCRCPVNMSQEAA